MPVGTHTISFGYKNCITNWGKQEYCRHLNLLVSKKIHEQSDVTGTE